MRSLPLILALSFFAGCAGDSGSPKDPSRDREAAPPPRPEPAPPLADPGPGDPEPGPAPAPEPAPASAPRIVAHTITLSLDPATHAIEASDVIELEGAGTRSLDFDLNPGFKITSAAFGRLAAESKFHDGSLHVEFPAASGEHFTVTIAYKGTLHDPPHRDEVRFVVGEKCNGTIQAEGAFLPGSAEWYPDIAGSMARFTVTARVPEDWEVIGQGARHDYDPKTRRATWCDPVPADRLDVVAGPYVAEELKVGRVTVRSYFFKEDASQAETYRKAAADWIDHWSKLLGPYPYDDFSIVENFFSTGYGMPAFTLLGQDVIRMGPRYLMEGGLGHEVLHCWWGNGVFIEGGNWCEAATTYCSNYHWIEFTQDEAAARRYRRHQAVRFSMHVTFENDYPVREFRGKVNEVDNEIGYGKGSMLFHLARRQIGDRPFWLALRRVFKEKLGARASWDDFRKTMEAESGEDLSKLFTAWLDEEGAPEMTLARSEKGLKLRVAGPLRDLKVRVRTTLPSGPVDDEVQVKDRVAEWTIPATATRVEVDPDFDVFRRLSAAELPLCLNRVVVAPKKAVIIPDGDVAPYVELLMRLEGWEQIKGAEATAANLSGKSVLVLGGPDTNALSKRWAADGKLKFANIEVRADGWTADNEEVKLGQDRGVLVSFASPDDAAQQAALFFPASRAATKPSRLLLYYAWDSWLVWRDGKIAARGDFPVANPLAIDLK
ncbi:MAG: M1 family aminopeptidase [Planctomycetota bacterium]